MDQQLIHCIWLGSCFLALFGLAELLYHKFSVNAEYTRKLVHIGTGVLTLLFPVFLTNHWYVFLLCTVFATLLLLSLRFNFLKSINAIDRESHGSLCYSAAVYGTFLFYKWMSEPEGSFLAYYYVPLLTLACCDPIAALCGKRWPWRTYRVGKGTKTMTGSIAFAVSATVLTLLLLSDLSNLNSSNLLLWSATTGVATAVAEARSGKGLDNLTIPATAMLVLAFATYLNLL
jgi:dolichol kinase